MPSRPFWGLVGMMLAVGCGSSDDKGTSGTFGAAGAGSTPDPQAAAHWDFLATTEGPRATERLATCEAKCDQEGACGFWDPGPCKRRCADPRLACQAELASDECWNALMAYEACKGSLTCAELNHLFYSGASVRACQTEIDAMSDACGYVETIASAECIGEFFDCGDGTDPISPYWVCDGEHDCSDGSDEDVCPWLDSGPPDECIDSATIDAEDTAGDVAALAGVTCIDGALTIRNTSLTNLVGLESLTSVNSLSIGGTPPMSFDAGGNPELTTLQGLEGLRGVGYLTIEGNPTLTDLGALSGLTFVTSRVQIIDNDALASLDGMHNIQDIDEVIIEGNAALTDLLGLRGLTRVSGFELRGNALIQNCVGLEGLPYFGDLGATFSNNDALVDFTGLESVTSVGNTFYVSGNDSLTSFNGLGGLTRFAWSVSVSNNPVLADLEALRGVTEIRGDTRFQDNPMLPQCAVDAWLTGLGVTCDCSGNDDLATCQ